MDCKTAHHRLSLAEKWLTKINKSYNTDDELIESYTEYLLIICRSVQDYIINDFLGTIKPKIPMGIRSEIIHHKKKYREGASFDHQEQEKIINFLKTHYNIVTEFENQLLVKYFITLRNWTVHTIFPEIYENQHGENNTVLTRRFQRNFVDYLGLEQGGHLLLESGYSLKLESSDEDSIFDVYPLNKLPEKEKVDLKTLLEGKESKELLNEYLNLIKQLISKFESIEN